VTKGRTAVGTALAAAITASLCACLDREPAQTCVVTAEVQRAPVFLGGFEGVDLLLVVDNAPSMAEEQAILPTTLFPLVGALVNPLPTWWYPALGDLRIAVVSADLGASFDGQAFPAADGWADDPTLGGCAGLGDDGRFRVHCSGKAVEIDGELVPCPAADGPWSETTVDDPDADLALRAACAGTLGSGGCGVGQPLASAIRALHRDDQQGFRRAFALLAVIAIGDGDDCSVRDAAFFETPELQDPGTGEAALACGLEENRQHLVPVEELRQAIADLAGHETYATFVAVTGVPADDACQGAGYALGGCLAHPDMQSTPVFDQDLPGAWSFAPACERTEGDAVVTRARPSRRLVELARSFGNRGYVFSICEPDWSPAVEDIAMLAAPSLCGTCHPKPLEWDPAARRARCGMVARFDDEPCPPELGPAEPAVESWMDDDGVEHVRSWCRVPALEASLWCGDNDFQTCPFADALGWYYCENEVDVEAEGYDGTCKYVVGLTDRAKLAVLGRNLALECPIRVPSNDPDCLENSFAACDDGLDNDGDGIWDCDNELEGEERHYADPDCCPMHVGDDNECVVDDHGLCAGSSDASWSDACRNHAALLQCQP
jgi:phenylpyruvate tautomerase PptA (4-oxalocrotonate tautomerase family)